MVIIQLFIVRGWEMYCRYGRRGGEKKERNWVNRGSKMCFVWCQGVRDRNTATYLHGDGRRGNDEGKFLSKMMKRDRQMRHTVGTGGVLRLRKSVFYSHHKPTEWCNCSWPTDLSFNAPNFETSRSAHISFGYCFAIYVAFIWPEIFSEKLQELWNQKSLTEELNSGSKLGTTRLLFHFTHSDLYWVTSSLSTSSF